MELDALALSRLQFAFTISFHIIFPSFTIGLASYLAVLEGLWLHRGDDRFLRLYDFWVKIFALAFAMGVVSGIVMSYQFGTNWSRFSQATGNILGPLLGYEVLTAFFLEASFLGIMLFGRNLVGPGLHFLATCIVAFGTLISAFWIISANSWMQYPTGYEVREGVFYATDWLAVIFNPTFPYRLVHMVLAAYLTTAFVVAGVAAFLLLRRRAIDECRTMLKMAFGMIAVVAPLQIIAGHEHGVSVYETQPSKLAAIEGHWESWDGNAPLILVAWPDAASESNRYELKIPSIGSLIVTNSWAGAITGLKEFAPADRPNVPLVFWSFRVMVAIGVLILVFGLFGAWAAWTDRIERMRWFQIATLPMLPSGFIAILAGWVTAEAGRQPWTVYGLMRTAESVSPVPTGAVATSLLVFVLAYAVVFPAGVFYMGRIAAAGPEPAGKKPRARKSKKPSPKRTAAKKPKRTARRSPAATAAAAAAAAATPAAETADSEPEVPEEPAPPPAREDSGIADIEAEPADMEEDETPRSIRDITELLRGDDPPDDSDDFEREEPKDGNP